MLSIFVVKEMCIYDCLLQEPAKHCTRDQCLAPADSSPALCLHLLYRFPVRKLEEVSMDCEYAGQSS